MQLNKNTCICTWVSRLVPGGFPKASEASSSSMAGFFGTITAGCGAKVADWGLDADLGWPLLVPVLETDQACKTKVGPWEMALVNSHHHLIPWELALVNSHHHVIPLKKAVVQTPMFSLGFLPRHPCRPATKETCPLDPLDPYLGFKQTIKQIH